MPHRGPRASLRQAQGKDKGKGASDTVVGTEVAANASNANDYRNMSAIQILKSGLHGNTWKKKGCLFDVLKREGLTDGSKSSRKELCWSY